MIRMTNIAAAIALALLAAAHPAAAQTKIKMTYTAVSGFTAGYVAQEQGFFQKHGVDVQFTQTNISGNIPAIVESGSVEVGGATLPQIVQADDAGLDLVVFAGGAVYPLPGDVLIARPAANITKTTDLKGKTVGVPGIGALLHIMLRRDLKANGVDPDSVKYVELGFPQAGDALKAGQIDAYPMQAPFTARVLQSGAGVAVANWLSATPDGTPTVIFSATRSWATAHKNAVEGMRAGMREALDFIKTHPDETNQAIAKYTGLPVQVVASIPIPPIDVDLSPKQIQFWIDVSKEQGLIKGNPKPQDVWFN
ncbi:MAG TPA: ABC transporter substrate-binding protein [Stellaceae bacterium]|jgi:NitT/TauT family transport system substrate-binding protein|nr:ABC transporter substrate-binding protein [Stellaceae bacterium]